MTARQRFARRSTMALMGVIACTGALVLAPPVAAQSAAVAAATNGPETRPFEPGEEGMAGQATHTRSNSPARVPASHVPRPASLPVAANPAAKAFEGLSLKDQRTADGGNQFSVEPPDQALCVGPDRVIEGVNTVFTIHDKQTGARSAPKSYSQFFNGVSEIKRTATPVYGPFISDPKCYWDPELNRFYMTMLELGTYPASGGFTGTSYVDIAVSKDDKPTTDPSSWHLYQLDVANNGGPDTTTGSAGGALATHPGCPCLGDQPLIGADRYGFFVTTNEFPIDGAGFNGAQMYAFDKAGLANGTLKVQRFENASTPLLEGQAYTVQPATSPSAAEWSSAANGTEYALSALDFTAKLDDRIAAWAFTNTQSLTTSRPQVRLTNTVISSQTYGQPPMVEQKSGPYPLGQTLKNKVNLLNSNDDRMNQVVYSGNKLWSGVNTVVKGGNGPTTTGIAYFVVTPGTTSGTVTASMTNQGYVSVNRNSVMFPSIGVTPGGSRAAMVFTLAGPGYYPSTAYVPLTPGGSVSGPVTVYGAGIKPADGFTGYPQYGGDGIERWGDYSAAAAGPDGKIWMAAEYIPGTFGYPDYLANWGTAIGAL